MLDRPQFSSGKTQMCLLEANEVRVNYNLQTINFLQRQLRKLWWTPRPYMPIDFNLNGIRSMGFQANP